MAKKEHHKEHHEKHHEEKHKDGKKAEHHKMAVKHKTASSKHHKSK